MRKFLLFMTFLSLCTVSNAQISEISTTAGSQRLGGFRSGVAAVMSRDGEIYLLLPSTNQFDDYFSFVLGKDKESALQTLDDLENLFASKNNGDYVSFQTCDGKYTYEAFVGYTFGVGGLNFEADWYAGEIGFSASEIPRVRKIIQRQ